jgi:hypothetical protein
MTRETIFTAQVVLRPAGAAEAGPTTSANLATALPDPAAASHVRSYFEQGGFEVGELVGTSFSVSGSLDEFAATFSWDRDDLEPILSRAGGAAEIDAGNLPNDVREAVQAVVVTPPPDFGPWNP